ncbi:MAG: LexA family transcriptional regulator [Thermodesulfobacteriota bacterium]
MSRDNSHNASLLISKLKQYYSFGNDKELADFLGIAPNTLASWKSRNSLDWPLIFAKCEDVSMEWLINDIGPPSSSLFEEYFTNTGALLSKKSTYILSESKEPSKYKGDETSDNSESEKVVLLVPVHGKIGDGDLTYYKERDPDDQITVPLNVHSQGMYYFTVSGDSMFPVIRESSSVGIDTDDKKVISGEIYAVWLRSEGVTLKYLFSTHKSLIVKSENPHYPQIEVPNDELEDFEDLIIGRMRYLSQVYE